MIPSVSIIMPVYNAGRFLAEAIESVIGQEDCEDWELLLIDDGSQDQSLPVGLHYCEQDPRIRLFTHKGHQHLGSSASRNLGLAYAGADLIALLDADDTWTPGKLRSQRDILARHPEVAMTYAAAQRWYSWDQSLLDAQDFIVPASIPGLGSDVVVPPPELLRTYLRDESATPCTCTVLVRKQAIVQAGAFEDSFQGLYDDQVFYAKLCLHEPVYVSSECLARYRQHDDSCCATARRLNTGQQGREKFLEWLEAYCPGLSPASMISV